MLCNHPIQSLIGTADGIECRICGAKFKSFDEIRSVAAPTEAKAEPKKAKKAKKAED